MQELIVPGNAYAGLDTYLEQHQITRLFLVCGNSIAQLPLWDHLTSLEQRRNIRIFRFSDFHPNPDLSSVRLGAEQCMQRHCSSGRRQRHRRGKMHLAGNRNTRYTPSGNPHHRRLRQ